MMNKATKYVIAGVILALSIPAGLFAQIDKPLATVRLSETEVVYSSEVTEQIAAYEAQVGSSLTSAQKQEILDSLINSILMTQAARQADLYVTEAEMTNAIAQQKQMSGLNVSDEQFQQIIEQQAGITWSEYRAQIEKRVLQQKYISYARPNLGASISAPTEQEIELVYEQNAQSFLSPAMSRFDQIFIDARNFNDDQIAAAREQMNAFNQRIRNGGAAEFDAIVAESVANASYNGGDFGYLVSGDTTAVQVLGAAFVQQVQSLPMDGISGVLTSGLGFHIVKITDKQRPRLLEINDPLLPGQSLTVRQQIIQYIMQQKQQQALIIALNEIVGELREEASIRIVDENLPW